MKRFLQYLALGAVCAATSLPVSAQTGGAPAGGTAAPAAPAAPTFAGAPAQANPVQGAPGQALFQTQTGQSAFSAQDPAIQNFLVGQQQLQNQQNFPQFPQSSPPINSHPSTFSGDNNLLQGGISNLDANRLPPLPPGFTLANSPNGQVVIGPDGRVVGTVTALLTQMASRGSMFFMGGVGGVNGTISTSSMAPNADALAAQRAAFRPANRRPFTAGPLTVVYTSQPTLSPQVIANRDFIVNGMVEKASGVVIAEYLPSSTRSYARVIERASYKKATKKSTRKHARRYASRSSGILK
jgi:hypothetical protein